MRLITVIIVLVLGVTLNAQTAGEKVIAFSINNLGKKVDRGECWDLANSALNYANAQWKPLYGFGDKIDYSKQDLKPGDILQFTNVKFIFKTGSASFPKHTAIVYRYSDKNVTLLHQNFNNIKKVDTLTINLSNIKNGKVDAYRPKAK